MFGRWIVPAFVLVQAMCVGSAAQSALPQPPAAAAPPMTVNGPCRRRIMPIRATASWPRSTGNVKNLQVAFTFSLGVNKGQEAAPLVVGATMYVVTPYPNILYALDLSQPGAPMKWKFDPKPEPASQGVACCDVVNRGATFANGRIYFNTLDDHTLAVDAGTGEQLWNTKLGNINLGRDHHDGSAGCEGQGSRRHFGRRIRGARLDHGSRLPIRHIWNAYGTGPDGTC